MPTMTSNGSTASYVFAAHEPPAFLVDAIPGARAAHDAWQDANAAGGPLQDAFRTAERSLLALRRDKNALTSDIEPAEAAVRAADSTVTSNGARALRLLKRFDAIVADAHVPSSDTYRLAASAALEAQARAVEARAALVSALDTRDEAWSVAGSPGHSWASVRRQEGGWAHAQRVLDSRVDDFDTAATEHVAAGGSAEHAASDAGMTVEQAARAAARTR